MKESIAKYVLTFKKLRIDRSHGVAPHKILRVIEQIKKGRFASKELPTTINQFHDANEKDLVKNTDAYFDKLFREVLDDFSGIPEEEQEEVKSLPRGIVNPKIVLTQSFN